MLCIQVGLLNLTVSLQNLERRPVSSCVARYGGRPFEDFRTVRTNSAEDAGIAVHKDSLHA